MQIKLSKPVARDSAADGYDVRQLKKTLNRLGYYKPLDRTGITEFADTALFDALKRFQKNQGLSPYRIGQTGR